MKKIFFIVALLLFADMMVGQEAQVELTQIPGGAGCYINETIITITDPVGTTVDSLNTQYSAPGVVSGQSPVPSFISWDGLAEIAVVALPGDSSYYRIRIESIQTGCNSSALDGLSGIKETLLRFSGGGGGDVVITATEYDLLDFNAVIMPTSTNHMAIIDVNADDAINLNLQDPSTVTEGSVLHVQVINATGVGSSTLLVQGGSQIIDNTPMLFLVLDAANPQFSLTAQNVGGTFHWITY